MKDIFFCEWYAEDVIGKFAPEGNAELYQRYSTASINQLIKDLDKERATFNALKDSERKDYDRSLLRFLKAMIAHRLNIYDMEVLDVFRDSLNERISEFNELAGQVKELKEQLKKHNHEYKGSFTSRARW